MTTNYEKIKAMNIDDLTGTLVTFLNGNFYVTFEDVKKWLKEKPKVRKAESEAE